MQSLNRQLVAEGTLGIEHAPGAPIRPVSILQIGDGNFLRAFVDWMVDVADGAGILDAGVAIAQPLDAGIATLLRTQGDVYTVLLRGIENGREVVSRRVVTCVADAFNPYAEWDRMLAYAVQPGLRFVVSNTTEAGIADVEEAFVEGNCPVSFPAKVAALLQARHKTLGGGADTGLVFLPCELIENNGATLRQIVLHHAERWGLDAGFVKWVEIHCHFLNTLVDRIVPGFPKNEAETLFGAWGYRDALAVAAEPFHVWVIEGPNQFAEELPLHKAGLNVVWTDDMQPYRTRKVRILNGAHTSSVLARLRHGPRYRQGDDGRRDGIGVPEKGDVRGDRAVRAAARGRATPVCRDYPGTIRQSLHPSRAAVDRVEFCIEMASAGAAEPEGLRCGTRGGAARPSVFAGRPAVVLPWPDGGWRLCRQP